MRNSHQHHQRYVMTILRGRKREIWLFYGTHRDIITGTSDYSTEIYGSKREKEVFYESLPTTCDFKMVLGYAVRAPVFFQPKSMEANGRKRFSTKAYGKLVLQIGHILCALCCYCCLLFLFCSEDLFGKPVVLFSQEISEHLRRPPGASGRM